MYIYPLEEIKKQREKQVRKLLIHLQDSNISTNASKTSLISVTVKENSTEILGYVNSSNSSKYFWSPHDPNVAAYSLSECMQQFLQKSKHLLPTSSLAK